MHVAKKLVGALDALRKAATPTQFADYLEASLGLLDRFDSAEDLTVQKTKNALRSAFLTELVSATRNAGFKVEPNRRGLSAQSIKDFIIEVFLKQQFMGYRFRTLSVNTLEEDPDPFLRTVVAHEAKIRQCDIIRTDAVIYLIAPVKSASQNPYSARRFLQEETAMNGSLVYFNGIIVPLDARLKSEENREAIKFLISRMVTLQRQVNNDLVAVVAKLEETRRNSLQPLLTMAIEGDGNALERAIAARISTFERKVEMEILQEVQKAARSIASTANDFEYLFDSLRDLLIELAGDVRDFSQLSIAVCSEAADTLDLKMMAMLRLLDKRREVVFVPSRSEEPDPRSDSGLFTRKLREAIQRHEKDARSYKTQLFEIMERKARKRAIWEQLLEHAIGLFRKQPDVQELQDKIDAIKHACMIDIIRIQKRHTPISVYMEYEEIMPEVDGVRHYAIARGSDGIGQLPGLLRLYEDEREFDIPTVKVALGL